MDHRPASPRVLVVEDEYFIAQDIMKALAAQGAVGVGPVASRENALRAIEDEYPDAAILDINIDGSIDFAIADELTRRRLPFVFATGYDAAQIPPRFAEVGRFEKPFEANELARHLIVIATKNR